MPAYVELNGVNTWYDERGVGVVERPVLVMLGDDDPVTTEHNLALSRGVPDGELAVIPRASPCSCSRSPRWSPAWSRTFRPTTRHGRSSRSVVSPAAQPAPPEPMACFEEGG
jgi:hypothetical protein